MPGYIATEEIDVFANGGAPTSKTIEQQYLEALQAASQNQAPINYGDIQSEAAQLSQLFGGNQRRPTLYDMASNLSQGLAQQAASGRPPSVGYGLAAGFNLFSEATGKKREAADALNQKLMEMAYAKTEKERERQLEFSKLAASAGFDYKLQQLKESGGSMDGTGPKVWAWNIVLEAQRDPTLKTRAPADYAAAVAILEKDSTNILQTETGAVVVKTPGYDVNKMFPGAGSGPSVSTGVRVDNGVTYTPVMNADGEQSTSGGKPVYTAPDGTIVVLD